MTPLLRILIVLTLALLGMQGASACEHEHASTLHSHQHESMRVMTAPCDPAMLSRDAGAPCNTHSPCCTTMCGAHCSALLSTASVPAHMSSGEQPVPHSDPARTGFTRAPPVRPPIA